MRIAFIGLDPDPDDECPAVFVDEDSGEIMTILVERTA